MGEVQADPFWPALSIRGARVCTPPSVRDPCTLFPYQPEGVRSTGREGSRPQPPSKGPSKMTSGEAPSQGIQKSRATFPLRTPIEARGLIPSAHPCHPGLFSGQELGINLIRNRPWR